MRACPREPACEPPDFGVRIVAMSSRIILLLRLLVLLAMMLAGGAHHVVMASATVGDHPVAVGDHNDQSDHRKGCEGDNCGAGEETCCVVGQCMPALAPCSTDDLPKQVRLAVVGLPPPALAGALLHPPLRPPV